MSTHTDRVTLAPSLVALGEFGVCDSIWKVASDFSQPTPAAVGEVALDHFPEEHRAAGMSFVMTVQFISNVFINVGFPIAVQALSGGPSQNQDKGIAITFIIFGSIGLGCFAVMYRTLFDYQDPEEEGRYEPEA